MAEVVQTHRDHGEEVLMRVAIGAVIGAAIGTIILPGLGTAGGAKAGACMCGGGSF
jgi:hypothetical protein